MEFLLLLVGLALIIKSADVLIESSSKIARKFGVSTFVIGITVVAFGTSAPELVVGIVSAISKTNQLALGNIIGSSISNTALILGISAMLFPLTVKDAVVKKEIPMLIFVQIALSIMVLFDGVLSRIDGAILLIGFGLFLFYIMKNSKKSASISFDHEGSIDTDGDGNGVDIQPAPTINMKKSIILGVLSLVGIFIGGNLTVENSTIIASKLGLNETIIGLTVVAIATTLPELITSIVAVKKNEPEIVLGNCVGSNLFNILLVLGTSSLINPIVSTTNLTGVMILMILLTLFILVVSLVKKKVPKPIGTLLTILYFSYLCFNVIVSF